MPTVTPPSQPPALPLEWTKIERKRPRGLDAGNDASTANTSGDEMLCCDDPTCKKTVPNKLPKFQGESAMPVAKTKTVYGKVVFCLPDANPSWFQGYFFVQGRPKPWGLLAKQKDLDECLQCVDGGYRQIQMKVSTYSLAKDEFDLETIEWTGGDMMRLENETVRMTPTQLSTGKAAIPYCEGVFGSLLSKLRGQRDDMVEASVLDLMPDVAVVVGSMELVVPVSFLRGDAAVLDDDSVV